MPPSRPSPAHAPVLSLRVLGAVNVTRLADGAAIATSPRQAALLAYLAVAEPRGAHARDVVAALLWPESDTARARRSLRNALHEIRRACGAPVVRPVGKHQIRLDTVLVASDLAALEDALAAGDVATALERHAPLLEGLHVGGAPGFEEWHARARQALRARVVTAAMRDAATRTDDRRGAVALLEAAWRTDPDDERVLRALLEALAAAGDLDEAHRVHRAHALRLEAEGTAPAPGTEALLARLKAQPSAAPLFTVALVPMAAPADDTHSEFARALDDGVRRRLSRRRGVRVVARAALPAAPDAAPLATWRTLGADLVVTCRLTLAEGELVVAIEVMRTADGSSAATLRHRAPTHDLFAVEGIVAAAILPPEAPGAAASLPPPQAPRDAEAHLSCLRGHWHFLRAAHVGGSREDLERSRRCFEEALARDPTYGAAYAGLSNYFAVCAARGMRTPFEEAFGQAIALSHRALELDASLAVPHVHFGVRALYLERDWSTAAREFAEAVRLDPGYAEAHRFLGIVRCALGDRAAGVAALREAIRLEPQTPLFRNSLADALLQDGAVAAAVLELEIALAIDPGFRAAAERLVRCHERAGRWAEAVAARTRLGAAGEAEAFGAALAAGGEAGYRAARRRELEAHVAALHARLAHRGPSGPGDRFVPPRLALALALAELGDWDAAWAVERDADPGHLPWFTGHPWLAPLASRRAERKGRRR